MGGLIVLGLIIVALAAFDLVALRVGVDSRMGFPDNRKASGTLSL